jgi:NDP-sugar pyrophosphorylase family protein
MKAMILAAGLGTRLKPLTDSIPKALVKVGDFTMLELTIRYLKKYGFRDIIINVHHFGDQIIQYMKDNNGFGISWVISDERNQLMDTGGAIVKASEMLTGDGPFLLMGTDVLTNLDLNAMIRFHLKNKPLVTLAVKDRTTSRSLLFNGNMQLVGWRDNISGQTKGSNAKQANQILGFSVIQIIQPEIFSLIKEKGPFSIIDLYLRLMDTEKILGYRHDESVWLEFGRADRLPSIIQSDEYRTVMQNL